MEAMDFVANDERTNLIPQVRVVAIYHFIAVPVRIVYQPFTAMTQIELLCTDLIADILVSDIQPLRIMCFENFVVLFTSS